MPISNYVNSVDVDVEKSGSTYTITSKKYKFGEKVGENTYTFNAQGSSGSEETQNTDPFPSITGIYQSAHPTTYKTDTSVQDAPLTLDPGGLTCAFSNCVSLTSVDLTTDVMVGSSFNIHHDAFAGCRSLTTVDLGTLFETSSGASTFENLFNGCTNLQIISGTIDVSNASGGISALKNMFKDCNSLESVELKLGSIDLEETNVSIGESDNSVVYDYAYEVLGLTSEQFVNAVTIIDTL